MNHNSYRWCAVSNCTNTSIKTPEKLFIKVPNNIEMRNVWLKLAKRDPKSLSIKSVLYLCEDHFNLPNDMENYMQYSIMGTVRQIRMKPDCIPSKFEFQNRVELGKSMQPRPAGRKRKQKGTEQDNNFSHQLNEENKANELCLYEEVMIPLSPSCIKEEMEFEEDSQIEYKVQDYETTINKLKEEIAELKNENHRLADENLQLAEENHRLKDKNLNHTSGIDHLLKNSENQMTNYEIENGFAEERTYLTNTIQSLQKEIKNHVKVIQDLTEQKQRMKHLQQKLQELQQEKEDLNQKNVVLENTVLELNRDIEKLKIRNNCLTEKVEGDRGRKSANFKESVKIRCLTEENHALSETVKELTDRLSVVNSEKRKIMKKRRKLT